VDFDVVDASNLQRQIIHSTADIGRKKLDSAAEKLQALNPNLNVIKHDTLLTSANALDILKDYDVIADGTDNFPTRYLVNDACVLLGKPNAKATPVSSPRRMGHVTAACIRNRRRRGWCRAAQKAECSEFCPAWSGSSRLPRPSSSSSARAPRWWGVCCSSMRSTCASAN
jgi:hypothetical protein